MPEVEVAGVKKQVGKPFAYVEFASQEELRKFETLCKEFPISENMAIRSVKHKVSGLHSFAKLKNDEKAKRMELSAEDIEQILKEPIALRISPLMGMSYEE